MSTSTTTWNGRIILAGVFLCIAGCATPQSKPQLSSHAQAEALANFSQGLLAESNDDAEAALNRFKEAIRIDPTEPSIYPPAIAVAMQLEQTDEALRLCRLFRRRQPEALTPRLLEAQVCMLADRIEEAEDLFRQTVLDFPDEPDGLLALSRFLVTQNRNEEAIELLEPEQARHPGNPDVAHLLGTLYIGRAQTLGEKTGAQTEVLNGIALIEQSLIASEDSPQLWLQLGYAYLSVNNSGKARDAFEKAYALYPEDVLTVRPLLGLCIQTGSISRALELCEEIPRNTRTEPELWFEYLSRNLPEQYVERLAEELHNHLEKHPQAPTFYYARLCAIYLDMDRLADAEAVLKKAAIRFPDDNRLNTVKGYLYLRQEQYEDAYTVFRKIQGDLPDAEWMDNPFFTFNLMVAAQKSGRLEEAAETLAVSYTNNPAILNQTMQALLTDESPLSSESTLELLRAFRTLMPNAGETLYYLSLLQAAAQKYSTALNNARQFELSASGAETNLLDGFFYYQYAVLHERTGRLPEAETYFHKAIELGNPATAASAQNYIAYMWAERGERLDAGLELIQAALEAEPDNPAFIDTLGWIYYMQGRYQQALTALKKAANILRDDPAVWEHLGDTYLKLGDRPAAVEHWKKALEISPGAERLLKRLKENQLSPDGLPAPVDSPADTQPHP